MNQENNQFNQNNFNTQDNNGIPNNQPLNNQNFNTTQSNNMNTFVNQNQQPMNNNMYQQPAQQNYNNQPEPVSNYQQPINQVNMQQPTPQPINTFDSGNVNNQNLNNVPPKKRKLGFIIGVICLVLAIVIGGIVVISSSKDDKKTGDNNQVNENLNNNNKEEEIISVKLPHEIFDVNKFDSTLFNGIVYGSSETQYKVMELLEKDDNGSICIEGCYPSYALTSNIDVENDSWNQRADSIDNKGIEFILQTLGNPSTIYEKYYFFSDNKDMKTGNISILYNYNDYIIDIGFYDYRQWKGYNYNSLQISHVFIYTRDRFNSEWAPFFKDYECYGEKLF